MVSPYYPNQVPWTDKENWVSPENPGDLAEADHVNQLYAEVNAIGQDVGAHKSEFDDHSGRHEHGGADEINLEDLPGESAAHKTHLSDKANPHNVTKSQIGLNNVDNVKQMPIAGGTFTGIAVAQNNTSYTTKQIRNIVLSTNDPSGGGNGDIWIKYDN